MAARAGMLSYLGTTDFRVICAKVVEGDPKYVEAYQALVYQLSKDIGAMAAVLHFDVDAIVFTGGMAYEQFFCDDITAYVGKIAQTIRLPRRGGDAFSGRGCAARAPRRTGSQHLLIRFPIVSDNRV